LRIGRLVITLTISTDEGEQIKAPRPEQEEESREPDQVLVVDDTSPEPEWNPTPGSDFVVAWASSYGHQYAYTKGDYSSPSPRVVEFSLPDGRNCKLLGMDVFSASINPGVSSMSDVVGSLANGYDMLDCSHPKGTYMIGFSYEGRKWFDWSKEPINIIGPNEISFVDMDGIEHHVSGNNLVCLCYQAEQSSEVTYDLHKL
jgi:hypothetical protein